MTEDHARPARAASDSRRRTAWIAVAGLIYFLAVVAVNTAPLGQLSREIALALITVAHISAIVALALFRRRRPG